MKVIDIQDVINSIQMQNDFSHQIFDKEEYDFITVTDDQEVYGEGFEDRDFEEAMDIIGNDKDRFIGIPTSFDVNAYRMMEDFIDTLDESIQDEFYIAIRDKGAFRRFKDMAALKCVIDDWYEFENEALKKIAIEWCKTNNIEYIETRSISND